MNFGIRGLALHSFTITARQQVMNSPHQKATLLSTGMVYGITFLTPREVKTQNGIGLCVGDARPSALLKSATSFAPLLAMPR
jgi:hypothetical protein